MGQHVLDSWILKLAGVSQELWRIQDCAFYQIILRLASVVTLEKVNIVENVSLGSKSVLSTTIYLHDYDYLESIKKCLDSRNVSCIHGKKLYGSPLFSIPWVNIIIFLTNGTCWKRCLQLYF